MITVKTTYKHAMLRALSGSGGTVVKAVSGAIASFNSNIEAAITKGIFDIEYDSDGISGMNIYINGKNFWPDSIYESYIQADGTYRLSGANSNAARFYATKTMIGKTFVFLAYVDLSKETGPTLVRAQANISGANTNGNAISDGNKGITSVLFTPLTTDDYVRITYGSIGSNYFEIDHAQIELNTEPTAYEPYSGDTYPVSFGTTIYGGYFDSVTGELYSTIDSDGTPLETPVKTELTPIPITTLKGDNNIFCDTGDSDIEYIKKAASKKDRVLSYLPLIYGRKELL